MKQHKLPHRVLSLVLCLVLLCGLGVSAHAADFKYPDAYWPLHEAWDKALVAGDLNQALTVAEQTYNLLMPYGLGTDVCYNLESKCGIAALACETKGDLNGAILWLERQMTIARWLKDNVGGYEDTLLNIPVRLAALRAAANPVIYALCDDVTSAYGAGPRQGTWYGSVVQGNRTGESAVLAYVHLFDGYSMEHWLTYYKNNYPVFEAAATQGGVIELAWNFDPANTDSVRRVLDGSGDAYISEGLQALSRLNATVLLRIGAEMNDWLCDPDVFRQAFRKIAAEARGYGNIQTVFSPNDIGNRAVTLEDYWPGDQYVDWVGMSTYNNRAGYTSYGSNGRAAAYSYDYKDYIYNDAFYCEGVYSGNPIIAMKSTVDFAAAHNKPVMVSECGFGYRDKRTGQDQTSFAAQQLTAFYSYVNMIYPQVKAVFYFNDIQEADLNHIYRLDQNSTVNSAYEAVTANGTYLANGQTAAQGWKSLDQVSLSAAGGKLKLATYAIIPGSRSATTSVSYFVDGKQVAAASAVPYACELDLSGLSAGAHTVRAAVTCTDGSRRVSVSTAEYTLEIPGGSAQQPAATAYASTQTVTVDGKSVEFQCYALKNEAGNLTNYVKLRDLAMVLNGTAAQFNVGWDGAVNIETGTAYKPNGTEMSTPFSGDRACEDPLAPTNINGQAAALDAFVLKDDAGNGYTYYKLRDLGRVLGFNVGWTGERGMFIESDKPYTDAD